MKEGSRGPNGGWRQLENGYHKVRQGGGTLTQSRGLELDMKGWGLEKILEGNVGKVMDEQSEGRLGDDCSSSWGSQRGGENMSGGTLG